MCSNNINSSINYMKLFNFMIFMYFLLLQTTQQPQTARRPDHLIVLNCIRLSYCIKCNTILIKLKYYFKLKQLFISVYVENVTRSCMLLLHHQMAETHHVINKNSPSSDFTSLQGLKEMIRLIKSLSTLFIINSYINKGKSIQPFRFFTNEFLFLE